MSNEKRFKQFDVHYAGIDREAVCPGDTHGGDPTDPARSALRRAVSEIRTKNIKRRKRIKKLRYLIYELQSIQPAELEEVSEAVGQSKQTTRRQIQKLIELDLVVQITFEQHTLYCLNGLYNHIISKTLVHGLLD